MSKTIPLRTVLQSVLSRFCENTAYGDASDMDDFPRIAYETRELDKDYDLVAMNLEINIIDCGDDETTVENMADAVCSFFDRYYHIDENIQFAVYNGSRDIVREDDKRIKRRRLVFALRLYERGDQ